jgi:ABC-type antimicrobial peptide transport system permease subunit
LTGVAIGIAAALVVTRLVSNLLYGVMPTDRLIFIVVSLILVAVSLLGSYLPARKAAAADAIVALRHT